MFPGGFYIELQRYGQPGAEAYIQQAATLAAALKLPVVATHPTQFMTDDDFTAHEARVYLEGDILANPRRQKRFTTDQYFRTQDDMVALFADLPSAIANTVEIAKRCNLKLDRQAETAAVPDAGRHVARRLPIQLSKEGRDPSRAAVSGRGRARRAA